MPRSGVIRFVGKLEVLDELDQQLTTSERVAISTLTGMGGIGKTELALQYALKDIKKTPEDRRYQGGICWLNAQGNIGTQLLMFIKECLQINITDEGTLEERIAIAWQKWPRKESLIIFDDVQELTKIEPFLPPNHENHIKVIITTRKQKIAKNFSPLPVELLSLLDSLELLSSFVGKNELNQDEITAKALCEWLGRLPLGIELVGRYIRETDEELITVFENLKALKLADESLDYPTDEIMTAKRGVAAAFELSWKQLSESAQILAMSLSLFAIAQIPSELLLSDEKTLNQIKKDLRDLKNLSLIKDIGNKNYELHPLIWQYFRAELDKFTESENLKREHCQLMAFIAQKMPITPTKTEIGDFSSVVPHLQLITEELSAWLKDDDLIWPYIAMLRFYEGQGFYGKAQSWCEECLRIALNRLGVESVAVLISFNNLANLYTFQGKYEEAEDIFSKISNKIKLEKIEDSWVSMFENNYAELYKKQGRYEEAENLLLKALERTQISLGEEHSDMSIRLDNLAELYRYQGKYSKAEPLALQAFNLRKNIYGMEHPYITNSLNNIANLYLQQGRYKEAEDFYFQSFELSKKLFGEESPETIISFDNLTTCYFEQSKYQEVEKNYFQSLNLSKKLLGSDHPDVANTLNNLGLAQKKQGKYEQAEESYRKALTIRKERLGAEHFDVAVTLHNIASLYETQEKFSIAETLYLESLEIKIKRLGKVHDSVAKTLNNLAFLYRSQRNYVAAISYYEDSIEIFRQVLPEEHPHTQTVIHNYLTMIQEAPDKEIFSLIAPEWKAQTLNMKTSFKTGKTIPKKPKLKAKKKIKKRGKGFKA